MVARGEGLGNRPDYEMVASYTSGTLQLVKSIVTFVALAAFVTLVALVSLVAFVSLVYAHNQFYFAILRFYFAILSAFPCHSERQRRISCLTA
jgi:predicted transcriptional regulator